MRLRDVGSIPTAPTITPDDSVALTLLGRVKRGKKKRYFVPKLFPIEFDLNAPPLRPDKKFSYRR